ncbi:MAG: hypothetical protein DRI65_04445 [Chloroflexota bacterium]|nr:MAG: hypothetical protein DRI65_04445 [Chloroflexota bacterium]
MSWQDLVNGAYEMLGAPFIVLSIMNLLREKAVKGVDWRAVAFFSTWSMWNLYYYPHLEQWASFLGGILIAAANLVWLVLMVYYIRKEKNIIKKLN